MGKKSKGMSVPRQSSQVASKPVGEAESYKHLTATTPLRPDIGTQAQFKKGRSTLVALNDPFRAVAKHV